MTRRGQAVNGREHWASTPSRKRTAGDRCVRSWRGPDDAGVRSPRSSGPSWPEAASWPGTSASASSARHRAPRSRSCPPGSRRCSRCCAAARSSSTTTTGSSRPPRRRTRSGLVRGTSLVVAELAELVHAGTPRRPDPRDRAAHAAAQRTAPRTSPRGSRRSARRLVLALVEDRTRERRVEAVRRDFVANVVPRAQDPRRRDQAARRGGADAADDPEAVERFAGRMLTESDRLSGWCSRSSSCPGCRATTPLDAPVVVASTTWSRPRRHHAPSTPTRRTSTIVTGGDAGPEGLRQRGAGSRRGRQPGRQRGRLLRRRLDRAGLHQGRRRDGRDLGRRPGHRHPDRRARPDLRAVLPRRPGPPPLHRRHRARALHRQARRGHPRRRDPCVVRRGPGLHVHPVPPRAPHQEECHETPETGDRR